MATQISIAALVLLTGMLSCKSGIYAGGAADETNRTRAAEIDIVVPDETPEERMGPALDLPVYERYDPRLTNLPGGLTWRPSITGLVAMLADLEIRRIIVLRYVGGLSKDIVKARLRELSIDKFDEPLNVITWSEYTQWTIEARIESGGGSKFRMLTDGSHLCLFDLNGTPWFSRSESDESGRRRSSGRGTPIPSELR